MFLTLNYPLNWIHLSRSSTFFFTLNHSYGKSSSYYQRLLSHVGFANPEGGWMVVDVWESAEAFAEFGKILFPLVQKTGVNVPEPKIIPAYYFYQAQTENAPA